MNLKLKRILLFSLVWLILLLMVIFSFSVFYLGKFARGGEMKTSQVFSQISRGMRNPYQEDYLTFLLLGLDQRPEDESLLTDTILLIVFNTKTGDYLLFSLPRDLWLEDLKTKVNALYYYGKKENPDDGATMVEQRLEEIFAWPIDYTLVLKMETIKELVDFLGGIEVEVDQGFVDDQFPKDDGSGDLITVEFEKGKQVFSGEKALQFMRSRKSADPIEGTDQARQKRQKKVILALKSKLIGSKKLVFKPKELGSLYQFLIKGTEIKPEISLQEMASFWKLGLKLSRGEQKEVEIPWKKEGAILTPGKDPIYQSWILAPKNNDWNLLKEFFKSNLP